MRAWAQVLVRVERPQTTRRQETGSRGALAHGHTLACSRYAARAIPSPVYAAAATRPSAGTRSRPYTAWNPCRHRPPFVSPRRRRTSPGCDTPSHGGLLFRLEGMETQEELRPYLFAIAYRMLGSVADAEDVVQEAFLRYHAADVEPESPKAYLATITTRLAIDQLARRGGSGRSIPASGYRSRWPRRTPPSTPRWPTRSPSRSFTCSRSLAGGAGGVPSARGLRLPVRGRGADRRQVDGELAADSRPRARAHRRGPEALRGLARRARGGRSPIHRSLGDGQHGGPGRRARARRDAVRRRRRKGSLHPRAARRRAACREGARSAGARWWSSRV